MADGIFGTGGRPGSTGVDTRAARKMTIRDDARAGYGATRSTGGKAPRALVLVGAGVLLLALVSGVGVMATGGGATAEKAKSLAEQVADREKRVAALDADRKLREENLAELQRKLNAKDAELADAGERVAALEKRRATVQGQLAELTGPLSASGTERASDAVNEEADRRPDEAAPELNSARAETPRNESVPQPQARQSSGSVDDAPREGARIARADPADETDAKPSTVAVRSDDHPEISTSRAVSGETRVFIHVRAGDPGARDRARAIASELKRRGVASVQIRGVRLPVRRDAVRYFHDSDRQALSELQDAVRQTDGAAPVTQDFRSFGAPPRPGTIELWLS